MVAMKIIQTNKKKSLIRRVKGMDLDLSGMKMARKNQ